jgi:hypothetical protein
VPAIHGPCERNEDVDAPNVDAPNVDAPNVDAPNVDAPNVDARNASAHDGFSCVNTLLEQPDRGT